MADRFVVLGLAPARADWFHTVGRWAASAVIPAEFVRCVSLDELRLRLASGRAFSAVLLDGETHGIDRDLLDTAAELGVAVLVVDDIRRRDWHELGAAAVLARRFSRDELLEVLGATAERVGAAVLPDTDGTPAEPAAGGLLVAVTGAGGVGTSTVAVALAQGLATRDDVPPDQQPAVLLADLCRYADQALLHDTQAVVPSVQELVDAHRTSRPDAAVLREHTFAVPARGYRLLLGLRRPRSWVALRPRAVDAAVASLQHLADVVVADVEPEVEGEAETGSVDIEDRNALARSALGRADLVVVVLEPSFKGVHAGIRVLTELVGFGVEAARIVPVVNRAPRSPRLRAEITTAVAELARASIGDAAGRLAPPLYLPERSVERALRDGAPVPSSFARSLARTVTAARERVAPPRRLLDRSAPVPVVPGSLSALTHLDRPEP
jgi:MinD-like ATPase involved in chromosome partitioning or flagellar assembly